MQGPNKSKQGTARKNTFKAFAAANSASSRAIKTETETDPIDVTIQ